MAQRGTYRGLTSIKQYHCSGGLRPGSSTLSFRGEFFFYRRERAESVTRVLKRISEIDIRAGNAVSFNKSVKV